MVLELRMGPPRGGKVRGRGGNGKCPANSGADNHLRDEKGDAMSVSVDKGEAGPTDTGLAVPDRAAFDRLEAEFRALEYAETLRD